MSNQAIALVIVLLVLFLWLAYSAIKIVAEYERLVVFRLGRVLSNPRGPGIVWLWPIIDRPVRVDLREQFLEIPQQSCITSDNAPILIDFLIYWKVTEPTDSVVQVANFEGASQGIATTTLRAVIGDISLDDVLAKREQINNVLRAKLDEVTARWGVKVTTVEIREILPPREVQDAMNRQMSAERNRRAMVTEAGGQKQSAILVAEGDKQSEILKAEGDRQATILRAEAEKQAQSLRAEGYATAINHVFQIAQTVDPNTMLIQYLQTLQNMAESPSTKWIFPMELAKLAGGLGGIVGPSPDDGESAGK
jgi:regulator of protease activity HflC (stomatin/prohibitin superfamily)